MITVTEDNYKTEVENSDSLTVIDFWASWCGPCKMLSPIMESLSNEISDVKFCKVNVDEQHALAAKFGIMSIPTLVFMLDGNVIDTLVGYRTKEEITQIVEEYK